jgi:hypothetical protein
MFDGKYEVRDAAAEKVLNEIGQLLRTAMPPNYGFNLLIFSYGEGGNMFYTSSARREDMIAAMREFIAKFEGN